MIIETKYNIGDEVWVEWFARPTKNGSRVDRI